MFLRHSGTGTLRPTRIQFFLICRPRLHGRKAFLSSPTFSSQPFPMPRWKANTLVQTFDVYIWVNRIKDDAHEFSIKNGSLHPEMCDLTSLPSSFITPRRLWARAAKNPSNASVIYSSKNYSDHFVLQIKSHEKKKCSNIVPKGKKRKKKETWDGINPVPLVSISNRSRIAVSW